MCKMCMISIIFWVDKIHNRKKIKKRRVTFYIFKGCKGTQIIIPFELYLSLLKLLKQIIMSTKFLFSFIAFFAIIFANCLTVNAQGNLSKKNGEGLIISTTSSSELNKIKENLEGVDPSTYRITVKKRDRYGNVKTTVLGTAPISEVQKVRTNADVKTATIQPGGFVASDVIIIMKNITSSSVIQDKILQNLDFKLSHVAKVSSSVPNYNYNYGQLVTPMYSQVVKPNTGKALILSTTSSSDLANVKSSLKGIDPSTYRITVKKADRFGNVTTTVLGTAPLNEVAKVRTNSGINTAVVNPGGFAASDVIFIMKNITSSSVIQDQILQGLDKNFSKAVINDVQVSPNMQVSPNISKFNYPGGY